MHLAFRRRRRRDSECGQPEGPSTSGGRAFLSSGRSRSPKLTRAMSSHKRVRNASCQKQGEGCACLCTTSLIGRVRPMKDSPLAQRHDHRQLKHAHSTPVLSAFPGLCFPSARNWILSTFNSPPTVTRYAESQQNL
jgi:hypothetical protein